MQTSQSPFSYFQQFRQEEFLMLKNLLQAVPGEIHFFVCDDRARVRDITPLSDDEILRRLRRAFDCEIGAVHLEMPLIALIDYLF